MAESDRNQTDGTLDPIEAEVERDRAELVGTVEALRRRLLSSGTVRSEVGRYVAGRRQGAATGLGRLARDHPLETVALGAGAAYPIVRVALKIPAPILLLGAGVALAGRGGSKGERAEDVETVVVEETTDGTASRLREPRVSAVAADAPDPAATSSATAGRGAVRATGSAGRASGIEHTAQAGGEAVIETIRRHPGAAAGVSLLIGGALAMMLPRSRAEERLYGRQSEEVRERARALASDGIESGRRVVEAARDEADQQGLTSEGARRAIDDVGRRAREAVDDMADDAERALTSGGAGGAGAGKDE